MLAASLQNLQQAQHFAQDLAAAGEPVHALAVTLAPEALSHVLAAAAAQPQLTALSLTFPPSDQAWELKGRDFQLHSLASLTITADDSDSACCDMEWAHLTTLTRLALEGGARALPSFDDPSMLPPSLRSLVMRSSTHPPAPGGALAGLTQLRALRLRLEGPAVDVTTEDSDLTADIQDLAPLSEHLTSLEIEDAGGVGLILTPPPLLGQFTALRELRLRYMFVGETAFLRHLTTLTALKLDNAMLQEGLPRELELLTALRELSAQGLGGVHFPEDSEGEEEGAGTGPEVTGISSLAPLRGLSQLTYLSLAGCTFLSEPKELQDLTSLQELHVEGAQGVGRALEGLNIPKVFSQDALPDILDEIILRDSITGL